MIKKYFAASLLVAVCSVARAQSPPAQSPPAEQQTPPGQETSGSQPPPLEPGESGAVSLVEGILDNTANHLGFSFSMYEMRSRFRGSQSSDLAAGALYSQIFTNRRGRRSSLHLDYGFGYTMYHGKSGLNNTHSHSGSASWEVRLARYTSFSLTDTISSSPNDYGFSPGGRSQIGTYTIYSQEVLVDRQRLIANTLTAGVKQRLTKKINASVFGRHDYLRFSRDDFRGGQGFQVGVRADYQINGWLHLDNSYSTYLNTIDDKLLSSTIHRLDVGGFRFKVSRNIQFTAKAGVEYTRYLRNGQTFAGFEGVISRNTRSNSILILYHRGLSTILGPGTILQGHNAALSITQNFLSRFTLQLDGSYVRGGGFTPDSSMENISANGGLQIGLQSNLIASTNFGFVSQHLRNLPFVAPDIRSYTAFVGLQYLLPTLRGR